MDDQERLTKALAGRYAIEGEIGSGGMATVYLAQDLKHDRKVAVKVLHPELAAVLGADRFLNEIKVTANLQHSHILPLFDSGEADSFLYYVMPFVEGESLRRRLNREKQLPIDEAVSITQKVAGALNYAHHQGVVHRDIKPENILLHQGDALVADFGIALAVSAAGGKRLTDTGLSLGTPEYMSPEQAVGDPNLDAKSDIYSLGCVAYEMLVGDPPHSGATIQAIIGKIVTDEPQRVTAHRKSIPLYVEAAVRCALEKVPADRFASAECFSRALREEHFRHRGASGAKVEGPTPLWNGLSLSLTVLLVGVTLLLFWALLRRDPQPVVRTALTFTDAMSPWSGAIGANITISPDGSLVVYRGSTNLLRRSLDQLEPVPIPGTERAINPVISPDGTALAFTVQGTRSLNTVSLSGAPPFTVVESGVWDGPGGGMDWGRDGMLYYTDDAGAIQRVPVAGGTPEPVTSNELGTRHAWVDALPEGRGLLFTITGGLPDRSQIAVVSLEDGEVQILAQGAMGRYASSGHLVFATSDGTLLSAPFDLGNLSITGPTVQLDEVVEVFPGSGSQFALSETGSLLYIPGGGAYDLVPVWVEREGAAREIDPEWRPQGDPVWSSVALSPEGTRLAISIRDGEGNFDLWVKELDTGPRSRITFEGGLNYRSTWSEDGRWLTFVSNRAGQRDLWRKRADGSSTPELVLDREQEIFEVLFSPDSTWLVFREGGYSAGDIYARSLTDDSTVVPLVTTEYQEREIALSPDGRWLAYVSNRSGLDQVYVRPFPDAASAWWQVSPGVGTEPVWAHSGRELFYRNGSGELVTAEISSGPSFSLGRQEVLFSIAGYLFGNGRPQYDVSPDDQRFIFLRIGEALGTDPILVQDFSEVLRERVGG